MLYLKPNTRFKIGEVWYAFCSHCEQTSETKAIELDPDGSGDCSECGCIIFPQTLVRTPADVKVGRRYVGLRPYGETYV